MLLLLLWFFQASGLGYCQRHDAGKQPGLFVPTHCCSLLLLGCHKADVEKCRRMGKSEQLLPLIKWQELNLSFGAAGDLSFFYWHESSSYRRNNVTELVPCLTESRSASVKAGRSWQVKLQPAGTNANRTASNSYCFRCCLEWEEMCGSWASRCALLPCCSLVEEEGEVRGNL